MPGSASRKRQHRQGPHTLSAVDEHAFDIGRRGRASIERCIMSEPKFGAPIGVMEIDNDFRRIEQDDDVLREIGEGIDLQIALAQEHRSGLGNGYQRGARRAARRRRHGWAASHLVELRLLAQGAH